MMASRPLGRAALGAFILLWIFFAFAFLGGQKEWYPETVNNFNDKVKDQFSSWTSTYDSSSNEEEAADAEFIPPVNASIGGLEESLQDAESKPEPVSDLPISYQLDVAPKIGCESVVSSLQLRLITEYAKLLKGVRYANIWGYLETENKGDAAIWVAQQILLSMMGIKFENACRFMRKGCDLERFNATLREHKPYSAILMAGGGNFNDYYWEDQPSRIEMIDNYHDIPVRAFPQSVHMTKEDRIQKTKDSFGRHPNLQVAARDQPSYDWLSDNLNQEALGGQSGPKSVLVPDIAFMWGSRPDFRTDTVKTHDILILARDDNEISAGGDAKSVPFGTGVIDLGGNIGNVTYQKVDWKFTHTPGIDNELPKYLKGKLQGPGSDAQNAQNSESNSNGQDKNESEQQQEHTEHHTEQHNNEDQSHGDSSNNGGNEDSHSQEEHKDGSSSENHSDNNGNNNNNNNNDNNGNSNSGNSDNSDNHSDNNNDNHSESNSDNHSDSNNDNHSNSNNDNNNEHSNNKRGFQTPDIPEFIENSETGRNQRAWAKAIAGFELLGSAKFVITDRLHGHIMSTIIGVPHVLMDSKLGKNLNFHNTWTQDCECTKITTDFEKSLEVAKLYFESLEAGSR